MGSKLLPPPYVTSPPAAEFFTDRTDVQCLHRWQKVLNPDLVKGPWSKEVRRAGVAVDTGEGGEGSQAVSFTS